MEFVGWIITFLPDGARSNVDRLPGNRLSDWCCSSFIVTNCCSTSQLRSWWHTLPFGVMFDDGNESWFNLEKNENVKNDPCINKRSLFESLEKFQILEYDCNRFQSNKRHLIRKLSSITIVASQGINMNVFWEIPTIWYYQKVRNRPFKYRSVHVFVQQKNSAERWKTRRDLKRWGAKIKHICLGLDSEGQFLSQRIFITTWWCKKTIFISKSRAIGHVERTEASTIFKKWNAK